MAHRRRDADRISFSVSLMDFRQSRFVPTREAAEDLGIGTATVHRARKSLYQMIQMMLTALCGHGALIKSGKPARSQSIARDEQAAQRATWSSHSTETAVLSNLDRQNALE
jgi:hypothetical protein